jgi:hypothetical protein
MSGVPQDHTFTGTTVRTHSSRSPTPSTLYPRLTAEHLGDRVLPAGILDVATARTSIDSDSNMTYDTLAGGLQPFGASKGSGVPIGGRYDHRARPDPVHFSNCCPLQQVFLNPCCGDQSPQLQTGGFR